MNVRKQVENRLKEINERKPRKIVNKCRERRINERKSERKIMNGFKEGNRKKTLNDKNGRKYSKWRPKKKNKWKKVWKKNNEWI